MQHARTGLKIEKNLYLLAQKKAGEHGQSFASYVTDLIAVDLAERPEADKIPDILRVLGLLQTAAQKKAFKRFQREINDLTERDFPPDDSSGKGKK